MPNRPPAMKGDTRATLMCLRCGQMVEQCSSTPAPVTMMVECSGSTRCSQIEEAASAKAMPEPPAAMPPSSAPSQRMAMVSSGRPNMPSAEIKDEDEPGRTRRGGADGDDGGSLLAEIEKLDGQAAQAQR